MGDRAIVGEVSCQRARSAACANLQCASIFEVNRAIGAAREGVADNDGSRPVDREATRAGYTDGEVAGVSPSAAAHIHRASAAGYQERWTFTRSHLAICIRHNATTDREATIAPFAYAQAAGISPSAAAPIHRASSAGDKRQLSKTHLARCIRYTSTTYCEAAFAAPATSPACSLYPP